MNNTKNSTEENTIFSKDIRLLYIAVASIIIVFGVFLNMLVVLSYLTKRLIKTHFNFFLFHLSVANIGEHIGFIPSLMMKIIKNGTGWKTSLSKRIMCGLTEGNTPFFIAVFVNAFLVIYVSILRYRIVCHSLKIQRKTRLHTKVIFTSFWIAAAILLSLNFFRMTFNTESRLCEVNYDIFGKSIIKIWSVLVFFIGFILPIISIVVTSILISLFMCRNRDKKFESKVKLRHRKKVVTFQWLIMVFFLLSWCPFAIYWILNTFGFFDEANKINHFKELVLRWVMLPCLLPGILNVFSYGILNDTFRRGLIDFLKQKKKSSRSVTLKETTKEEKNWPSTARQKKTQF